MDDLSAFVLAGGKSSRMGSDKAFLELNGSTLLARTLRLAKAVTKNLSIVGTREKFESIERELQVPVIEDVYRGQGPLAGIHAALRGTHTELNLVISVDMPFLESRFLEFLVTQARSCDAVVTVPRANGSFQPLCAIYRPQFREVAQRALDQGNNKIGALFSASEVSVRIIEEDEIRKLAFDPAMFHNLNTPEDLRRAAHLL